MARRRVNAAQVADYLDPLDDDDADVGVTRFHAPEELLDHEDPANDRYFKHLQSLRALTQCAASALRPRQAEVARLHHRGKSNKDIAQQLGYSATRVSILLTQHPGVREYVRLLGQHDATVAGPSVELRKNVLWRIAANSETRDPGIAIAALRELNRMDGSLVHTNAMQAPTTVNIQINQDVMPRTALDTYHETLDAKPIRLKEIA